MNGSKVAIGLSALAAVQLTVLLAGEPVPIAITRGETLPFAVRTLGDSQSLLDGRGCLALVICTSSCPYCATRASNRRQVEANAPLDVAWIIVGSREAAAEFARVHGFGPNELGFVDPADIGGLSFRRSNLLIPGTPLRVVLDDVGKVTSVALTHEVPSPRELPSGCKPISGVNVPPAVSALSYDESGWSLSSMRPAGQGREWP